MLGFKATHTSSLSHFLACREKVLLWLVPGRVTLESFLDVAVRRPRFDDGSFCCTPFRYQVSSGGARGSQLSVWQLNLSVINSCSVTAAWCWPLIFRTESAAPVSAKTSESEREHPRHNMVVVTYSERKQFHATTTGKYDSYTGKNGLLQTFPQQKVVYLVVLQVHLYAKSEAVYLTFMYYLYIVNLKMFQFSLKDWVSTLPIRHIHGLQETSYTDTQEYMIK